MKRILAAGLVLFAIQAALAGIYLLVERGRRDDPSDFAFEGGSGDARRLSDLDGPVVLHLWATWCPPCREELPGLLAYAAASPVPVLAVSLDTDWAPVRSFLDGSLPPAVVRALEPDVASRFDVSGLPATLVLDSARNVTLRLDGARDWRAPAVRAAVEDALNQRRGGDG